MLNTRARLIALAIMLGMAATVFAADVWRVKDYKQWDIKDVDKVLNDSPWVKTALVGKTWTAAKPAANGSPAQPSEGGPPPASGLGATSPYTVRWTSAVTVHHAVARNAELNNQGNAADAEKYANTVPDTYDIAVIGDMTPFGPLDTTDLIKQLQATTSLEIKEGGIHLTPVKVELGRNQTTSALEAITFHFAKTTAGGAPVFPPDAKGVDFICKTGKMFVIKVHFDFTKMTGQNGLDL
ncbi:MAG: hypothetical protein ABSA32_02405 [Candidatus Acidiferrales bacterium]|jgi:hypothetical protein